MKYPLLASLAASVALLSASPATAGKPRIQTLPAPEAPCDLGLTTPDAIDCSGYYSQNLLSGNAGDIADQQEAIALLDGDFEWDGDWAEVEATKLLAGDLSGPDGDQLDFGTEGADFVMLDSIEGFSNAVLYTTGTPAVPEPGTWAMMLLGFGAAGYAMRRNRRKVLAQTA